MPADKSNRRAAEIRYGARYQIFRMQKTEDGWTPCFYCGHPADCLDHHPPISKVDEYEAFVLVDERYVKVWCCQECNRILGDSLQLTLLERDDELKARLAKKYSKYLFQPEWSEAELKMMGPVMRGDIRRSLRLKKAVTDRLQFSQGVREYTVAFTIREAAE